jgi:hypothetical protein
MTIDLGAVEQIRAIGGMRGSSLLARVAHRGDLAAARRSAAR